MRRAYIEVHCPLPDAYATALEWAGAKPMVVGDSASSIEDYPFLEEAGLPIAVTSKRRSRFTAKPAGIVVAWRLSLAEVLSLEARAAVTGVVLVGADPDHRAWVTAWQVESIGGKTLKPVADASPAVQACVKTITSLAFRNQGLTDSRERHTAIHALTALRKAGQKLRPNQLVVEALHNDWRGKAALDLAQIAEDLNAGRRLPYQPRLTPDVLASWLLP